MKITSISGDMAIKLAIGISVAALAWFAYRKLSTAAASAAATVVDAAAGAVDVADNGITHVVTGIGGIVGIPSTDESECAQLLRDGRTWDASFKCPAKTFLSYMAGNNPQQDYNWQAHGGR